MLCYMWQGGAKVAMTPAQENNDQIVCTPYIYLAIESYPYESCMTCKRRPYECKWATNQEEPIEKYRREVWQEFKLDEIRVPRITGDGKDTQCLICHVVM